MTYKITIFSLLCGLLQMSYLPAAYAASDCSAIASDLQKQSNGKVLSVKSGSQNGAAICIVDILIPGENGNPPRKKRFKVQQ